MHVDALLIVIFCMDCELIPSQVLISYLCERDEESHSLMSIPLLASLAELFVMHELVWMCICGGLMCLWNPADLTPSAETCTR